MFLHVVSTAFLVFCSGFISVKSSHEPNDVPIIIIGAGAAGIAALTRLLDHNFTGVMVLEPAELIGGRISSIPFPRHYIDLGAEFCHGEKENVVFEMAKELKLLASQNASLELYYSAGGYRLDDDVQDSLLNLTHSIRHRKTFNADDDDPCSNTISEGVCLNSLYKQLINNSNSQYQSVFKSTYTWLTNYKCTTESSLYLDDVSLVSDYEESEGDQMLSWQGRGYQTILNLMLAKYSWTDVIQRNVVNLISMERQSDSCHGTVTVFRDNGRRLRANHVIFTPSLGVLKAKHNTLFTPPLPSYKQTAIRDIGFGSLVKIGVMFENSWWNHHEHKILSCIWSPEDKQLFEEQGNSWVTHFTAFTTYVHNPRVLMAWFAGEKSPEIELLSDAKVIHGLGLIIFKCFSHIRFKSAPIEIVRSQWWTSPNFLGAFSYDSVNGLIVGQRQLRENLARPIMNDFDIPTLLFAGEATHPTKFGTVHGAIETGYREADRLIDFYSRRT